MSGDNHYCRECMGRCELVSASYEEGKRAGIEGRGVGRYAPSSARENERLLDAIEQSIHSLSRPLGPMETATRVKLAADHGLSYVTALRERLSTDLATTPNAGGARYSPEELEARASADHENRIAAGGERCAGCGHNEVGPDGLCHHALAVHPSPNASWRETHCGHKCVFPAPEAEVEDPHPGYDCGGTCAVHSFAPIPTAPAQTDNETIRWCQVCTSPYVPRVGTKEQYRQIHKHTFKKWTATENLLCWCGTVQTSEEAMRGSVAPAAAPPAEGPSDHDFSINASGKITTGSRVTEKDGWYEIRQPRTATPSDAAREHAHAIVGTVFENTAASDETLEATMIERITDYLTARFPPTEATQAASLRHYFCSCGGALTAEEYVEHYFEKRHDRAEGTPAAVERLKDEVERLTQQNAELKIVIDVGTSDDPATALSKLHKIQHAARTNAIAECVSAIHPVLVRHYNDCTNSVNAKQLHGAVSAAIEALKEKGGK